MTARHAGALRTTAWSVGLFYLLIVFEFFYMASPFAIYFYSAYHPGLEFLERVPWLSWLTRFFLPHFADTSSALVDSASIVGGALTAIGVLGFLVAAFQVYSRKLLKRGAATGGMYRFVRHPQYASLMLAGAGMLLLWPRFLMAAFFVTMLFAYRALAWIEEGECVRKFGEAFAQYQQRTPQFLPFRLPLRSTRPALPQSWPLRASKPALAFVGSLAITLGMALGAQEYSIRHLFTYPTDDAVYVALTEVLGDELQRVADAAGADPRVIERVRGTGKGSRFVNYVMPWEWAVPEIPMNDVDGHHAPRAFDPRRSKIVYARAVLPPGGARSLDIVRRAVRVEPVAEAWIDESGAVVRVLGPPRKTSYGAVPVPVF